MTITMSIQVILVPIEDWFKVKSDREATLKIATSGRHRTLSEDMGRTQVR